MVRVVVTFYYEKYVGPTSELELTRDVCALWVSGVSVCVCVCVCWDLVFEMCFVG